MRSIRRTCGVGGLLHQQGVLDLSITHRPLHEGNCSFQLLDHGIGMLELDAKPGIASWLLSCLGLRCFKLPGELKFTQAMMLALCLKLPLVLLVRGVELCTKARYC